MEGDPEKRWFTIYVHTCDLDPRGSGERPTEGKQYVGQAVHTAEDFTFGCSDVDVAERAMMRRWRQKIGKPSHLLAKAVMRFGAESFRHEVKFVVFGQTAANMTEVRLRLELDTLVPHGYDKREKGQTPISFGELSDACSRGKKAMGPERRSAARRKANETMGPERRSAAARKGKERMGLERRRAAGRKAAETSGPEKRRDIRRQQIETLGPEGLHRAAVRGAEAKGIEGRRTAARKAIETMGSEGLRNRSIRRAETMGRERLSAATRKAMETKGPEGRRAARLKQIETMGPEGQRAANRKRLNTRWLKAFERAIDAGDIVEADRIAATSLAAKLRWAAEDAASASSKEPPASE